MDPRRAFPPGMPARDENEMRLMGSWLPATPQRPIPVRFNSMPAASQGNQLNQGNWQGVGVPGRNIQELPMYKGRGIAQPRQIDTVVVPQIGQAGTSAKLQFTQTGRVGNNASHFGNSVGQMATNVDHFASQLSRMGSSANHFDGHDASAANSRLSSSVVGIWQPVSEDVNLAWARMLGVNNAAPAAAPYRTWKSTVNMATCPASQNLQPQVNRSQESLGESLISNRSQGWTTDTYWSHDSSSLQSKNELPIPHHPWYDLNAPPRMENDGNSCTSSSQLAANSTHGAALENIPFPMATYTSRPSSTGEEGKQCNLSLPTEYQSSQNQCDGLLQNILSSSSSGVASPLSEEPKVDGSLERGKGIDLDQTPAKKPPKRRKHRAKVIREGKPERAKNVAAAKSSTSEKMQTGKRKYVRKAMKEPVVEDAENPSEKRIYEQKKSEASAAQQTDPFEETSNPNGEFPGTSCRRVLDYDMEPAKVKKQATVEAPKIQIMDNEINLNANFITTEASLGANSMDRTNEESQISLLSKLLHGIHHPSVSAHHIHSSNNVISAGIKLSPGQKAANRAQGEHEEVNDPTSDNGISMTEGLLRDTNFQYVPRMSSHPIGGQSSKRKHHQIDITGGNNSNSEGSVLVHRDDHWQFKKLASTTCSENTYKLPTVGYSGESAMSSHAKAAKASSSSSVKAANAIGFAFQRNTYAQRDAVNHRQNDRNFKTSYDRWLLARNTVSESHIAPEAYNSTGRTVKCSGISEPPNFAYSARTNDILQPNPEARGTHKDQILSTACHTDMLKHQHASASTEPAMNQKENINKMNKQKGLPQARKEQSTSQEDGDEQAVDSAVEAEIIYRMANLHLSNRTSEEENKDQNALVLYKGDGTIVPYEGSELVKKRKPRPKVDLDQESERVWKLLMAKGESDDPGNMDKEKQKWWEEERRIFHGRAESFIARMHLVQGDRRFSKWKGSVVDSVIGVFLTQNVSDHLSSSAFMSLAARFPLKSTRNNTSGRESASMMFKQPDISKETRETIKWIEELLSSSHSDQSNLILNEPTSFFENYETPWIENSSIAGVYSQNQEEEVLSSQGSSDSIIIQAPGGVGSHSGSNSEAEELASGCNPNTSLDFSSSNNLHLKNITLFEENHSGSIGDLLLHGQSWKENQQEILIDRMQMPRMNNFNRHEDSCTFPRPTFGIFSEMQRSVFPFSNDGCHATAESEVLQEGLGFYAEESMSSFPFLSSTLRKEKDTTIDSKGFRQTSKMMNNMAALQWERPSHETIQTASTNCLLYEPQQYKQTNLHPPHKSQIVAEEETSHSETAFSINPTNLARAPAARQNQRSLNKNISNPRGNTVDIEDEIRVSDKKLETGNKPQQQTPELYSTGRVTAGASKEPLTAKKGKASGRDAVDWDSLRKEAQATNGVRERSTETMDSLDYEALRSASVSEVSCLFYIAGVP